MSGFLVGGFSSAAISRAKCLAAVAQRFEGRPRRVRAVRQERRSVILRKKMDAANQARAEAVFLQTLDVRSPQEREAEKKRRAGLGSWIEDFLVHTLRLLGIMLAFPFVGLHIFKEVEKS